VQAPYYVICGLSGSIIFPRFLINGAIFVTLLNVKCVFWFYLQLLSATFLILRILIEVWSKIYTGLHVKYLLFLSDFNQTWIFSSHFRKIPQYPISWKTVQWETSCFKRTDGRTDRHDEANSSFSQDWVAPIRGPYIAPESDLFHYSEVYFTLQTLTIIKRLNLVPTITSIQSIVCLKDSSTASYKVSSPQNAT
jgi:hypothetical protein